jgi:bifunctional non-homologous end joining protein LigD
VHCHDADGVSKVEANMGLKQYKKKRKFNKTPEPKGVQRRSTSGALRFVVQKHDASRLHYDFRLELGGVMLSWAVPKGPSLDPSARRLAMRVEDHPLEYRAFEGIIPEGNYGAGTVMIWDEGTYEPVPAGTPEENQRTLRAAVEKGHLRFILHGRKLRGRFSLVRMNRGNAKEWLLFKAGDDFASDSEVTEQDRSAVSGRSLDEIAAEAPAAGQVWQSNRPNRVTRFSRIVAKVPVTTRPRAPARRTRGAPFPHHIKPMLATLVDKPFDRSGWIFEIKWDGFRAISEVQRGRVKLYSRTGLSFEQTFRPVVESLRKLGHDAVLDGELVVLDEKGRSHFQDLQNYQNSGQGRLVYYVFDLLYLDGEDLRPAPLRRRKEMLQPLLKAMPGVRYSDHVEEQGVSFFKAAVAQGLEGVIAKDGASPYREGKRSAEWLKIKVRKRQEAVIGGFTSPRGTRKALGALVLGVYDKGELVYIGHTGGGFTHASLAHMHSKLEPLIRKTCPFKKRPKTNMPATWVEPKLVCEVMFQEWTADGTMRQPIFLGLREDKPATSVHREEPANQ